MEVEEPQAYVSKLKEENMYIKSYKPIPIDERVTRISAGSEFCFGWN
jgi:hypothetical protein